MADDSDGFGRVFQLGGHPMPGYWRHALPEDLEWLQLPQERLATCDHCFWAKTGDCRADCQCCTYFPQLPNFSLGLALGDPTSRDTVLALIAAGDTLPQGLLASPKRFSGAAVMQSKDQFGEDPNQLCPFLESGSMNCRIYPYRNSVCSTFFCENDHGDAGADVWSAIQLMAGHTETALSQWAMTRVGLDAARYIERLDQLAERVDDLGREVSWSRDARQHLWEDWFGKEEEFFGRCAEEIRAHHENLYSIACVQPLLEAKKFDEAVREWVPEPARSEIPPVTDADPTPIEDLWYRVQLKIRQLWQLPFSEGDCSLVEGVEIGPNPENDARSRALGTAPWVVSRPGERVFVSEREKQVLELFTSPTRLNEAFMNRPEVAELEDARGFLAEMFRRGMLQS